MTLPALHLAPTPLVLCLELPHAVFLSAVRSFQARRTAAARRTATDRRPVPARRSPAAIWPAAIVQPAAVIPVPALHQPSAVQPRRPAESVCRPQPGHSVW